MKEETYCPERKSRKRLWTLIGEILLIALFAIAVLMFFSARWLSDVFPDLRLAELVYHMKAPLGGTSPGIISHYVKHYAIPEFVLIVTASILLFCSRRPGRPLHRWHRLITVGVAVLCCAGIGGAIAHMDHRFGLFSYIRSQHQSDTFVEDHYVDPAAVELRFPAQKRNLIYIYLESMEITFADKKSGGAFEENYIPELTELALENDCFNGSSGKLNGAVAVSGATWTSGSIFAQSTGLPLKVSIFANDMSTQEDFFPSVTALGDILEDSGYTNVSMLGSEGEFAGEKLFFADHGDYRVYDFCYARDHGWIPAQYKVWWGYEDEKLFSFAKQQLTELAAKGTPFNLTMQTIDTHGEDGYVCGLCRDEFGDNQYANVFACSSRQVASFVRWVQEQDFYENTTIVLVGDHPTMDSNFCNEVPSDYQRIVYTSIINAAPVSRGSAAERHYSVFDLFPTTLAALGVEIEGNRLGLGANLYSDEQTLIERFGPEECNRRLNSRSEFLQHLFRTELTDALAATIAKTTSITVTEYDDGTASIYAVSYYDCRRVDGIYCLELEYWDISDADAKHYYAPLNRYSSNEGQYVEKIVRRRDFSNLAAAIQIVKDDRSSTRISWVLCSDDINEYLSQLCQGDYLVFVAACEEVFRSLDDDPIALLDQLGADIDLHGHDCSSYVLVADTSGRRSEPVCEALSDESAVHFSGEVDGVSYSISSAGFGFGGTASIEINGVEQAVNHRGLNIVVYDRALGKVIDSVCFDTHIPLQSALRK